MSITKNHIETFKKALFDIYPIHNNCWQELQAITIYKKIGSNEYFSKEGDSTKGIGFLLKGILRIYYLDTEGNEWNKHFLQGNDFVASSVSLNKKSITNIQSLAETEILFLPIEPLMKLRDKYKDLLIFIQKLTFSYLEQKQEREINLLSKDARSKYQTFKQDFTELEAKIQHYHIASYLGITPTQLSRIRKKIDAHQQM